MPEYRVHAPVSNRLARKMPSLTNEADHDPEVHRNIVAGSRVVAGWTRDRHEPRLCGLHDRITKI
jgi:hypothetical protein